MVAPSRVGGRLQQQWGGLQQQWGLTRTCARCLAGSSWLSLTKDLQEVAATGFPLMLASSGFGGTRVCTELEAQGSSPLFQRLFVLTGRTVLFLFGFKMKITERVKCGD